jgi:7-carboxy-7-deazaguanine synthase
MGSSFDERLRPLDGLPPGALLIHEIFASIQGESSFAGLPCVFVRTTACNLRCKYCDTAHAFVRGERMTVDAVVGRVTALGPRLVALTGGEPLLQPAAFDLMTRLCDAGFDVLLETSGSLDIREVDPRVVRVVDFKAPSSGEVASNRLDIIDALAARDEVKVVVGDRADYEWARGLIHDHELARRCSVLVGPVYGAIEPRDLAAWILEDGLPVRLQIQLHKTIWDPAARGV